MLGTRKVSIVGAGHVGESAAFIMATKGIADEVVMTDIIENLPEGKALDMMEAGPILGYDTKITGSSKGDIYEPIKGSDVVVMTAGFPRKPGMSRDDLLEKNIPIMKDVATNVKNYAPDCIFIIVANPLDAMIYAAKKVTGFPDNRLVGQAGALDSTRFMSFLAMEKNVSVKDVWAMTLGSHGDDMVPLKEYSSVYGVPVTKSVEKNALEGIIERTKDGGGEIVKLLGTSAYWAPASGICWMVESILRDQKTIIPCHAFLHGEYGVNDLPVGVPVKLGKDGVEEIVEIELGDEEKALLSISADHVKEVCDRVEELGLL
jgi:malate dehydrogenase